MKLNTTDALLALSLSVMSAGLISGGALIHESATGKLQGKPERATALFFSGLVLTHAAAFPLMAADRLSKEEA